MRRVFLAGLIALNVGFGVWGILDGKDIGPAFNFAAAAFVAYLNKDTE